MFHILLLIRLDQLSYGWVYIFQIGTKVSCYVIKIIWH